MSTTTDTQTIHIFCPSFPETIGTFRMTDSDIDAVIESVRGGFIYDRTSDSKYYLDGRSNDDSTLSPHIVWRHTWRSIKHIIARQANLPILTGHLNTIVDSRDNIQTRPMQVGDIGFLFKPQNVMAKPARGGAQFEKRNARPADKVDLKSVETKYDEFDIIMIERIE